MLNSVSYTENKPFQLSNFKLPSVADPRFPRGGGAKPSGIPKYDFAKFSQELHEIERIWTGGGIGGGGSASKNFTM